MQLLEYQAKTLLRASNIPVPASYLINEKESPFHAHFTEVIGYPAVVKSQVPVGGRGKLGGIKLVYDAEGLAGAVAAIKNLPIKGHMPGSVLVEQALAIDREMYLALRVNRDLRCIEWLVAERGGIDIEDNAASVKIIPQTKNNDAYETICDSLGLQHIAIKTLLRPLEKCFVDNDCLLLELNPLVLTKTDELVAADCKMLIDDNALFRHSALASTHRESSVLPLGGVATILREAAELGIDLSELKCYETEQGISNDTSREVSSILNTQAWLERRIAEDGGHYIGVIANGAGMAMSTMDTIYAAGGRPANFLDIGGGTGEDVFIRNLREITALPGVTSIIINIFAGITRCDDIARGIIAARREIDGLVPLFIRLEGTRREEAAELLAAEGVELLPSLKACVGKALEFESLNVRKFESSSQLQAAPAKSLPVTSREHLSSPYFSDDRPASSRTKRSDPADDSIEQTKSSRREDNRERDDAGNDLGSLLLSQPVIVQGITGHHGAFHTRGMLEAGTDIVAGVTPGKGSETVHGVSVYNSIAEALKTHQATTSVVFVPARFARDAMIEALEAGITLIVCITEHIPVHDMLAVYQLAVAKNATIIGPNSPGLIVPGSHKLGIIASSITTRGSTTIISRSGTLTYELAHALTQKGIGQRLVLGIGGDAIQGTNFSEALALAEADPGTERIILIGEIGGTSEQRAADYAATHVTKPIYGLVVGHSLPPGQQFGHAGAIVGAQSESASEKTLYMLGKGIIMSTTLDTLIDNIS